MKNCKCACPKCGNKKNTGTCTCGCNKCTSNSYGYNAMEILTPEWEKDIEKYFSRYEELKKIMPKEAKGIYFIAFSGFINSLLSQQRKQIIKKIKKIIIKEGKGCYETEGMADSLIDILNSLE